MKKVLISLYLDVTEALDFVSYCKAEIFKL